jgi:retinol-binding protein 3
MKAALGVVVFAAACASSPSVPPPSPPAPAPAPPPVVAPAPAPAPPPVAPQVVLPDTPAGKALSAWVTTFNGADPAQMKAFVAQYKAPPPTMDVGFRTQTGGFDVIAIQKSEPLAVTFVVKEHASSTTAVGWLKVKDGEPVEVTSFDLLAIPPGMTAADMGLKVDAAMRTRVIDAIATQLTKKYIYPDVAKKMIAALRDHQKKGDYDAIEDATAFAPLLTDHLRAISHDGHLRINYSPRVVPEDGHEPSADDKAQMRDQLEHMNCGFEKAERLDGNIGYIKFNFFGDVEVCGPKASAAFASLGDVDALIFDMRENGGGQPEMVSYVASYLFAKRTHLNDIYDRPTNKTTQFWTKPDVPGTKYVKQPVYVLTSARTFSGAEEFTYDLKTQKRATIVGETTGGGAHPTMGARLDDHFMIGVPSGRPINPITKKDWEGTGVTPDVKVEADRALEEATKLAEKLHATPKK